MATVSAAGTASPMAQGQATTSTATAEAMARVSPMPAGEPANPSHAIPSQPKKVRTASPSTTGTKMALARSAIRSMGARDPWACSTSRAIWRRVVVSPALVTRTVMAPS